MKNLFLFLIFTVSLFAQEEIIEKDFTVNQQFTFGTVKSGIVSINFETTQTIDWSSGSAFRDTIGGAINIENITFTNTTDGQWITLELYSNGANNITFATSIVWQGGVAPGSLTEDKTDILQFYKSGTNIFGMIMRGFK